MALDPRRLYSRLLTSSPGLTDNSQPTVAPGPVDGTPRVGLPPTTGPLSPGWAPSEHGAGRPVGSPQVANEAAGRYIGPPQRYGMQTGPNGRIYGAANVFASLFRNGFQNAGDPNYTYTQAQADADTAWAKKSLADDYAAGTMDNWTRMWYEDYLARGPGGGSRFGDALNNPEGGYDANGQWVGHGGEFGQGGYDQYGRDPQDQIYASYGIGPMPRVAGALDAPPTQGDWQSYLDWYQSIFPGQNPDPIYSGQDPFTSPDMEGSNMKPLGGF